MTHLFLPVCAGDRGDESYLADVRLHVHVQRDYKRERERRAENILHPQRDEPLFIAGERNAMNHGDRCGSN